MKDHTDWTPATDIGMTYAGGCRASRPESWNDDNNMATTWEDSGYRTVKPLALSVYTVSWLRDEHMEDESQVVGIDEWEDWWLEWSDEPVEDWDMKTLAGIFCKIFFLDGFRFQLDFQWEPTVNGPRAAYGYTRHSKEDVIVIRMDPNDHHNSKNMNFHYEAILSTFAHELAHGYFRSHCCDGADCHDEDGRCSGEREILWPKGQGNGHDLAWFFMACQISLCLDSMLGIGGHLSCFSSLILHFRQGGRFSAEDWVLFFYTFSWEDACQLFNHLPPGDEGYLPFWGELVEDFRVVQVWIEEGAKHEL